VASLQLLLTFLRGQGLLPVEPPRRQGPVEVVLERYRLWLRRERRLGGQTIEMRLVWARRFLMAQVVEGDLGLQRLGPEAVTAFVLAMAGQYSTGSMKHATSGLRSLLRFLFTVGRRSTVNCPRRCRRWPVGGWRGCRSVRTRTW
jgi:hypothetical protein